MSWPLGSITAVTQAVGAAKRLLHSASHAVDFHAILAPPGESSSPEGEPESQASLLESVTKAIRDQLSKLGLSDQGDLLLSTQPDGTLQLESPHELPAAIEATLAGAPGIRDQVARLHATSGPTNVRISWQESNSPDHSALLDLTAGVRQAKIPTKPGGYPNW